GQRDLQRIATFTNRMAAIGVSSQIDAQQVARDTALMLRGQAGMQVRTWTALEPHVQAVAQAMRVTVRSAQDFNRLRPEQRFQLMERAQERFLPLMARFNDTWDAVWGTTQSIGAVLVRSFGGPIFDAAKRQLGALNAFLADHLAQLQAAARLAG